MTTSTSSPRGAPTAPWLAVALAVASALAFTSAGAEPEPMDIRIEGGGASGDPAVTLSARDLDIRELLTMLSNSRGVNILAGPDVAGTVNVEFHEVPFEEALRAVVAMAGFEVSRQGNLYLVRTSSGDPRASLSRTARTFRLDYAKSDDVFSVVEAMLSPNGRVVSYPPLRALVVEDQPDVLARVESTIASLDRQPRQVIIEAQILEARLAKDHRYGIDWSQIFSDRDAGSGDVTVEGFASSPGASNDGMFITWGRGDFTGMLEAVESIDRLQSLAAPRLLVVDGADAEIIIGGQLGFPVVRTVENTVIQSVEFLDTGTQLIVSPTIAENGYVLMRVHPELSDGVVQEGLPSKTTTQVSTDVLVKDGHTLLIGGLIREREEEQRRGVPILMRLPILGGLFGKTIKTVSRSELITIITPRIVRPDEPVDLGDLELIGREGGDPASR